MFVRIAICLTFGGLGTVSATTTEAAAATTTAYDWGNYVSNGAGNVCRHTDPPHSNEQGRTQAYMAVTWVKNAETCRQFCDQLQPCYGFEFDSDSGTEHKKGNCEIWVVKINHFASANNKFSCYNLTTTYSSSQTQTSKVMAGFEVTGYSSANLLAIGANHTLTTEILATVKSKVSAHLVNATMGEPNIDQSKLPQGKLYIMLEFTADSGYHAAELHNQIRALGRNQKLSTNWDKDTLDSPTPGLTTEIINYMTTLGYGTPQIVWDFTTLSALVPVTPAPTATPTPAPSPTPGGTSIKQTTDSANFQSPALLLLGGILASVI